MPGFCASIVITFISGVELFDYVVDGGICESLAGAKAKWVIWPQGEGWGVGGIKPSGCLEKNGRKSFVQLVMSSANIPFSF